MRVERAVLDTNVLISAAIQPLGPSRAVLAWVRAHEARLVFSPETLAEVTSRLMRPKFGRYLSEPRRRTFLTELANPGSGDMVRIAGRSMGCRDPGDDKVIETALVGGAEVLVTGDADLLSMPARPEFRVLTARGFLEWAG